MKTIHRNHAGIAVLFFITMFIGGAIPSMAQPAGMLYDPEPPVDSAYIRVIVASKEGVVDISIDGKPRILKLKPGTASEYMVVSAGKHTVAFRAAGKTVDGLVTPVEAERGSTLTLAVPSVKADVTPVVFRDRANSNKLKSLLTVYHLDQGVGSFNISTADGKTKVFSDIAFGKSASIQVNPIKIELIVADMGSVVPRGRVSLSMSQGGNYSIFIYSDGSGKSIMTSEENKTERFVK